MLVAGKIPFTEGVLSGYPGQERCQPVGAQSSSGSTKVPSATAEVSSSLKQPAQSSSREAAQQMAQSATPPVEPTDGKHSQSQGDGSELSHSDPPRLSPKRPVHGTDDHGPPQDNLPHKPDPVGSATTDAGVDVKPSVTQRQGKAKSPAVQPKPSRAREPSSSAPASSSTGAGLVLKYPAEAIQQSQAIRRAEPASSVRRSVSASSLKPSNEARSASRSASLAAVAPKRRRRVPDSSSDEDQPPPQPRFRVIYKQRDEGESPESSSSSEDEDATNDTVWFDPQDQQRLSRQPRNQEASNVGSLVMRQNGKLLPAALRPRSGAASTWRKKNEPAT